jgi:hypothetical protein
VPGPASRVFHRPTPPQKENEAMSTAIDQVLDLIANMSVLELS